MFSSDKNIELIRRIGVRAKRYAELRMKIVKLDFVGKMTILLSALILGAILFMLFTIVVLFLSYAAAMALAPLFGSVTFAFVAIAVVYVGLSALVYVFRRKWIIDPMARFLGNLFLDVQDAETQE